MNIKKTFFKWIFEATLKLRNEDFYHILQDYDRNQHLPIDQLHEIQLSKLNNILAHASHNSPYYQSILPDQLTCLGDLSSLPTLDKEILRNNISGLYIKYGHLERSKTSGGSTGAPVSIIKNSEGIAREMAASWRGYAWAGIEVGDRQARFWGVPRSLNDNLRAKLIDFICHRIRITAFGYNEITMEHALKRLERFRPDYLYGYTSIIEDMARHIELSQASPPLKLKSIITTSEVLSGPSRKLIENVLNAKVFDEYGCGEIGTIAHECEHGRLHLNMENSIVEIVDENGQPVSDGQSGEMLVTDLTNYSMPLIRYKIKDFGTLSPDPCECGRTLKVLEKVFGRQYDALINSANEKFHGEFFLYIAEDAKKSGHNIQGIQFIQDGSSSITVKLSPIQQSTLLEKYITDRIKQDFDPAFEIKFDWVTDIPRESSGKLRVVKYEPVS